MQFELSPLREASLAELACWHPAYGMSWHTEFGDLSRPCFEKLRVLQRDVYTQGMPRDELQLTVWARDRSFLSSVLQARLFLTVHEAKFSRPSHRLCSCFLA